MKTSLPFKKNNKYCKSKACSKCLLKVLTETEKEKSGLLGFNEPGMASLKYVEEACSKCSKKYKITNTGWPALETALNKIKIWSFIISEKEITFL